MTGEISDPVPVPADTDLPDKIVAGLTARQAGITTAAAVIIWAGWAAARHVLPLPAFAMLAAPVALAAAALVTGERDGLTLDRLLAAWWRQARSPRRLVTAPGGIPAAPPWVTPPGPPAPAPAALGPLWQQVSRDGVIGLGSGGAAAVAAVSTVNFTLRSPAEQDAATAAYGRWLNSLTGPAQILIRAGRADLTAAVTALRDAAPALPHPALEAAALQHAAFLARLARDRDVLTRQALLVTREPARGPGSPGATTTARAARRAGEAARLLAGAGLVVRVLDGGQVTALLAACADPAAPVTARRLAVPGQPVTGPGRLA